eukprot:scaffold166794_cov32-Tisochrysis_lutea.AAC.2
MRPHSRRTAHTRTPNLGRCLNEGRNWQLGRLLRRSRPILLRQNVPQHPSTLCAPERALATCCAPDRACRAGPPPRPLVLALGTR